MQQVAIFGCGGLGQLVRDILIQGDQYAPAAFLDSDPARHGKQVDGLPVLGGLAAISRLENLGITGIVVAIGDNRARVEIAEKVAAAGIALISAIHPLATVSARATVAAHVIIGARVIVCVNTSIGAHTILSAGAIADHDIFIGAGVHIHPAVRLAGGVRIEDFATLQIGASVIPDLIVGHGATVEAGAVVIRHVAKGEIVGGVPARSGSNSPSRFVPAMLPPVPQNA